MHVTWDEAIALAKEQLAKADEELLADMRGQPGIISRSVGGIGNVQETALPSNFFPPALPDTED